jgi:ABC-type transport system substrate-binding protein
MRPQQRKFASIILGLLIFTTFLLIVVPPAHGIVNIPFTVYLSVAGGNPARLATVGIISDSFRQIGIDSRIEIGDAHELYNRVFFPDASQLGATFLQGGWDIFFCGWVWDPHMMDPTQLYDSRAIPTYNFMFLDDSHNDALLNEIRATYNKTARWELLKDWQAYIHDISPLAILLYLNNTFAYDPGWTGFEDIHYLFPVFGDPIVRHSSEDEWIIGINADPDEYLPLLSTRYYNKVAIGGVYESLFRYEDNRALFNFTQKPALAAANWIISDDGLNWTLDLRQNVYWPTGHQFNASDVYMTYKAHVIPSVGAAQYDQFVAAGLNNESFEILNSHRIRVYFNDTLGPYGWAESLLNIQPLPSFALGTVLYEDWQTHPINIGTRWTVNDTNDDPYTCYGPMGLGPYVCNNPHSGWNSSSQSFVAHLRGSSNDFGLTNGTKIPYFKGVNGFGTSHMPLTYSLKTIRNCDSLIDALRTGDIDLIDQNAIWTNLIQQFSLPWGVTLSFIDTGFQMMGFNLRHPIFGTGIDTPNGQTDPANASLYAKYVRQALNYLIPRQAIADTIYDTYAIPGLECISPVSQAFNFKLEPYTYQREQANTLLRLAGYYLEGDPPPSPMIYLFILGVSVIIVEIVILVFFLRRRQKDVSSKSN